MTKKTNNKDVKSFSEVLDKKSHNATNFNSGEVNLAGCNSDLEVNASALLQNTALAITDPYLLPNGKYPIFVGPDRDNPLWKVFVIKTDKGFDYEFFVEKWVHKAFMMQTQLEHDKYKAFLKGRKTNKDYVGKEIYMPPWVAVMVELTIGYPFESPEFRAVMSKDEDLQFFWINKSTIGQLHTAE